MNYSVAEQSSTRTEDEALIEAGVQLLPSLAKALYAALTDIGAAHGLTAAQVKVLLQLDAHRQMTISEIAAGLACSMPAASEVVDRLVDAGHLVRASDPTDRRRVLINATPASAQIAAQLRKMRRAQMRHAIEQLAPNERPIFIESLRALVAGLIHEADVSEPRGSTTDIPTP